jgi:hypothetical protein
MRNDEENDSAGINSSGITAERNVKLLRKASNGFVEIPLHQAQLSLHCSCIEPSETGKKPR